MSEDKRDFKEEKEYAAMMEKQEGHQRMGKEYEEVSILAAYPPIVLKKNYDAFSKDVVKAFEAMVNSPKYDSSVWGKVKQKWAKEIEEAKSFYADGKTSSQDAAAAYLKKNKNVNKEDFALQQIFR